MSSSAVADPFGTLRRALWIGGGQWAGKTTVAGILARRHALTVYHYDVHDARGHDDRRVAARARRGEPLDGPGAEAEWVEATPDEMARRTLDGFPRRFGWALDDLAALEATRPILAEGWGLRPELVARLGVDVARMVVLVATDGFVAHQLRHLDRAGRLAVPVSDPARAQRHRVERDRLVARDAVRQARALGVPVVEVDGARDAEAVADLVEDRFRRFLRDGPT